MIMKLHIERPAMVSPSLDKIMKTEPKSTQDFHFCTRTVGATEHPDPKCNNIYGSLSGIDFCSSNSFYPHLGIFCVSDESQ